MSDSFNALGSFFRKPLNRRVMYLIALILAALLDYLAGGLTRRTFMFYTALDGRAIAEDRMLRRSGSQETDIRRYLEDALLGPVSTDALPLIPLETKLSSFMYRKGAVYAGFTEEEGLFWEDEVLYKGFLTLNEGLRRNFPFIKDVKFFVGESEIYASDYSKIFADSADKFLNPVKKALTN